MKNLFLTLNQTNIKIIIVSLLLHACSQESPSISNNLNQPNNDSSIKNAPDTDNGNWGYLGGDAAHTRYSPADKITLDNFEDLEEDWVWDGASFNAASGRSTPSYINGKLYTVAGPRRYVVALENRFL